MASKTETHDALLEQIHRLAGEVSDYPEIAQAEMLVNLALAYRYVAGGPQPGGHPVEKG